MEEIYGETLLIIPNFLACENMFLLGVWVGNK